MKAKILSENCIGCGQCACTCEDVFRINDEGFAEVIGEINKDNEEDVKLAASGCPTDAIVIEK